MQRVHSMAFYIILARSGNSNDTLSWYIVLMCFQHFSPEICVFRFISVVTLIRLSLWAVQLSRNIQEPYKERQDKWAGVQHFLQYCMYTQRKIRSCASAQSSRDFLWVANYRKYLQADSEGSDQPARMHRLICLRWAHRQSCRKCCAKSQIVSNIWAALSKIVPSSMRKMCRLRSICTCAKPHPRICSPLKHIV